MSPPHLPAASHCPRLVTAMAEVASHRSQLVTAMELEKAIHIVKALDTETNTLVGEHLQIAEQALNAALREMHGNDPGEQADSLVAEVTLKFHDVMRLVSEGYAARLVGLPWLFELSKQPSDHSHALEVVKEIRRESNDFTCKEALRKFENSIRDVLVCRLRHEMKTPPGEREKRIEFEEQMDKFVPHNIVERDVEMARMFNSYRRVTDGMLSAFDSYNRILAEKRGYKRPKRIIRTELKEKFGFDTQLSWNLEQYILNIIRTPCESESSAEEIDT